MTLLVDECCARDKCLLTTTSDVTIANTTTELTVDATYQWGTASAGNSITSNILVIQTST